MNKFVKLFLIFLLTISIATPSVLATQMNSGDEVVLSADETVEGNYFAAGDSVTISGTVNGDLYVAGGNVIIEGTVNGDILVGGGNITMRGVVEQDMRVVGGNIVVTGTIGRNLTAVGGSVNITDAAEIQGSVVASGGSIQIFTTVPQSVTLAGGNVEIGSDIGGDVFAAVGEINITPQGSISGDLTYYSEEELNLPQGATVSGEIVRREYPNRPQLDEEQRENIAQAGRAASLFSKILNILSAFIIGAILLKLFPKYVSHVTNRVSTSMWKSMGVGLLFIIVVPIVAILLLVTLIGMPIGFLLFFAYFFSIYMAKIFISIVLGRKLFLYFKKEYNDYVVLFIGLLIYLVLTSLPIIGWLVVFISVITGIGGMYLGKKDYYEEAKAKKII